MKLTLVKPWPTWAAHWFVAPLAVCCLVLAALGQAGEAAAQDLTQFFKLANPAHLDVRLFATGYGAEKYGTMREGFELSQTVSGAAALVGRVTSYQIFQGTGFDSPLMPSAHSAPRNLGRFQGGLNLIPFPGASFTLLGGKDVGDSDAPVFENDFSSWQWMHTRHPVNFSYSTSHYYENGVTNGLIDLRTVALSGSRIILLLGVGGAVWGGGTAGQAKGQGGPDLGVFIRKLRMSIDLQAGYGSSRTYGTVSVSRTFSWSE